MALKYPASWLDELRSRADIVNLVSGYVSLKKDGKNYKGLCPFHQEKTASFHVSDDPARYYCFGCKATGDAIDFIREMEHLDFQESVRFLADRCGLPLPAMEVTVEDQRMKTVRERNFAANLEAARFFHEMLFQPIGAPTLEYFRKRGLSDNVIRKFGLGADPGWDLLLKHMIDLGYTEDELHLFGLITVKEAEPASENSPGRPKRVFDMFHNRAIFPIIDQFGKVLAFGGRATDGTQPKYLNTSDTPVFNKRNGVYAANLLKKERNLDKVILVEGYMDVVSLTQFGVKGVCATLGTALTQEQARLMRRFAPKIYLGYDGDGAGQKAILRGLEIMEIEGIPVRVLDFPEKLDPDEYIRKYGPEMFNTLPAITGEAYRMRRLKDGFDMSTEEGRTDYAKACAKLMTGLEPVEKENLLKDLMIQTGFSREVLEAQINSSAPAPSANRDTKKTQPSVSHPAPAKLNRIRVEPIVDEDKYSQQMLISYAVSGKLPAGIVDESDFTDEFLSFVWRELSKGRSISSILAEGEDHEAVASISANLITPVDNPTDEVITMANDCVNSLRRRKLEKRLKEISNEINTCTPERKKEIITESMTITARLKQLKGTR